MAHTYFIGLPDAQKRYTQKRLARGSALRSLTLSVLLGAITVHDFNSISLVRMCEQSRGM